MRDIHKYGSIANTHRITRKRKLKVVPKIEQLLKSIGEAGENDIKQKLNNNVNALSLAESMFLNNLEQ